MENFKSEKSLGDLYKELSAQLDLAMAMVDEGLYSVEEYESILYELKRDFLKLDGKNN